MQALATSRHVGRTGLCTVSEPLIWFEGNGTSDKRFFHADNQGSIIATTDSAGNTYATVYDEYGIRYASNETYAGRFSYTGQAYLPEIGMYYYKARMYNPIIGRFMQTDPIGYGAGMNWYNYVGSDSVNYTDPWGLQKEKEESKTCPTGDEVCDVEVKKNRCSDGWTCISGDIFRYTLDNKKLYFEMLIGAAYETCSTLTIDASLNAVAGTGGRGGIGAFFGRGADGKLRGGTFYYASGSAGTLDISLGATMTWLNGTTDNVKGASLDGMTSIPFIPFLSIGGGRVITKFSSGKPQFGATYLKIGASIGLDDALQILGLVSASGNLNATGLMSDKQIQMTSGMTAGAEIAKAAVKSGNLQTNCKR